MRSEASYPGSRSFQKMRYPEGVIADSKRVGNDAFSVEEAGRFEPRVARFAPHRQPWATRSNTFSLGDEFNPSFLPEWSQCPWGRD